MPLEVMLLVLEGGDAAAGGDGVVKVKVITLDTS